MDDFRARVEFRSGKERKLGSRLRELELLAPLGVELSDLGDALLGYARDEASAEQILDAVRAACEATGVVPAKAAVDTWSSENGRWSDGDRGRAAVNPDGVLEAILDGIFSRP